VIKKLLLLCFPEQKLIDDVIKVSPASYQNTVCYAKPSHSPNLSRQRICFSPILKLPKMEGVLVLTRNNRSIGPESTQKRLPDLCPRCQSPNCILRNLSLCSRQYVSDQMTDLCSLRNLKEGINGLISKQAGIFK